VLPFVWNNDRLLKNVLDWRERYKRIGRILNDHPEVLDVVHEDVASSGVIRNCGDF